MTAVKGFSLKIITITFVVFQIIVTTLHGSYAPDVKAVADPKTITVIGTGYVGLVCGAGLAEFGHKVICADIDKHKIESLKNGVIPIFEPGLKEIVLNNVEAKRLSFTDDVNKAIQLSEFIFLAVGTPTLSDGQSDLSYVESAARTIALNLNNKKTICIKSTVPIGTMRKISGLISQVNQTSQSFEIVFNPEFLREGTAVYDFFEPDRVVFGIVNDASKQSMNDLYSPLLNKKIPFLYTSLESAEAIKYASNAFLAVKISFINEFAKLCDKTGADVVDVATGMGLDKRIGSKFLNPGPGYGGSCFPKDTLALIHTAKDVQLDLKVVEAAVEANESQKQYVIEKARTMLNGTLSGKTIGILGLAFKPNTDDIRCAPSLTIIDSILNEGGHVKAYDPEAINNTRRLYPQIEYTTDPYKLAENTDIIILLTEWEEFRSLDLYKLSVLMNSPAIVDTRNILDPAVLKALGYKYENIGRPNVR